VKMDMVTIVSGILYIVKYDGYSRRPQMDVVYSILLFD